MIKFIPYTITTGFTAGIAVTIVIGQVKDFFGLTFAQGVKPVETVDKLKAIVTYFDTINTQALLVGAICLLILIVWPMIPVVGDKIPGSLIAVIAGILLVQMTDMKVNTIGDLYTISGKLPKLAAPHFSLETFTAEISDGFTIAILAAIESLLSCVVADSMINSKHRSNAELVAQGIGNIGSVLFGGIPATGAIARTATNVKNGGRTPVAGMIHSIVLVLVLVALMPYAALIPMPTIAAILFMVAYNMCGWKTFVHLCKTAPKSDIIVLVVTFVLTVVFDLVAAIEVGMIATCFLFIKRMSEESVIKGWKYYDEDENDPMAIDKKSVPKHVRVYEISGPMFFGMADEITENIHAKDFTRVMIIRMRGVPAVDATAMKSLEDLRLRAEAKNIQLVFSHVNEQPMKTMEKSGFVDKIGRDNFCDNIDAALKHASKM